MNLNSFHDVHTAAFNVYLKDAGEVHLLELEFDRLGVHRRHLLGDVVADLKRSLLLTTRELITCKKTRFFSSLISKHLEY